jgi:hypothetical protein
LRTRPFDLPAMRWCAVLDGRMNHSTIEHVFVGVAQTANVQIADGRHVIRTALCDSSPGRDVSFARAVEFCPMTNSRSEPSALRRAGLSDSKRHFEA